MIIKKQEYFNGFRDRVIFGEKAAYYLSKKLKNIGVEVNDDENQSISEDAFYLSEEDLSRLLKNINFNYKPVRDECDFYHAASEIKSQINSRHLKNGVKFLSLSDTYIDENVIIGKETMIYPNTYLEGKCEVGDNCVIGPESKIVNSTINSDTNVLKSVIMESVIGSHCNIGPFAYIRPESNIGDHVKIGDFVEIKKSVIKENTKISHLAYIGDSEVGRGCNISCGVITANYDGKRKYKTTIGDNAFIGCNVTMVAPVTIESDTYIAAGSTITETVKSNSLAIARERQTNKEDWVIKKGFKKD
ncbi:MAG: UDP-N-acetylglucosamine pyrophosphorylase [Clostridia bacterium]|nr:UDP-N-acetylglucosamine pyrophosphorylase [Clostridia bacterium]